MSGSANPLALLVAANAVLFAIAAGAKLRSWASWSVLAAQVIPTSRAGAAAAVTVPVLEAAVAVLTLVRPVLGLAAAALVLASFAAALQVRLGALTGAECNCFGALLRSRIGPRLVLRNAVMAGVAGLGAVLAMEGSVARPGITDVALSLAVFAAAGAAVAVRSHSPNSEEHGPRLGSRVAVPGVPPGRPVVAAFLSPGCPACEEAAPVLGTLADRGGRLAIVVAIGAGPEGDRGRLAATVGGRARLDLVELRRDWNIKGSPFTVAIDERGRVVAADFGASPARLEEMARAALDGVVPAPSRSRPAGYGTGGMAGLAESLLSRRQAFAAFGSALLVAILPGPASAGARGGRRKGSGAAPGDVDVQTIKVPGSCKEFFDKTLDPRICGKETAGGCTLFDGFLEGNNDQIGSKLVSYREKVTNEGGVFCPNCATASGSSPGKCFPNASECTSGCRAPIGSCAGTCAASCNERVCIEAVATQELIPNWRVVLLSWQPGKGSSADCRKYAGSVNAQIRDHELDGHLARGRKNLEDKNKYRLENQDARACAPTYAEARAQIDAEYAFKVKEARTLFVEQFIAENEGFHHTPAGQPVDPDCSRCR